MHTASFLQDLAVVMLVAGVVTVLFRRLRQPAVLGYILAGLIIGPHFPPAHLIRSEESIHTLSELGVVFLLFSLGLEFHLNKLRRLGASALFIAPLETGLMFFLGYQIGQGFGWKTADCVYLGGILMISSTTIINKTLNELKLGRERFAQVIYGVLIMEDIIAILLVASLSGAGAGGAFDLQSVGTMMIRLALFLVVALTAGLVVVPRLLAYVAGFRSDETLLVSVLGLAFGTSLLADRLGFSTGLGAFVIGSLIAGSDEIRRIERLVAPVRDLFSAVFFVAIGMLIDPAMLGQHAGPVAVIAVALLVGKMVSCTFGSLLAGNSQGTSLRVGLGMAQIGEFSFIIAAAGAGLGVTSSFLYPIAVTVSAITSALTPYLIRGSDRVVAAYQSHAPSLWQDLWRDYGAWITQLQEGRSTPMVVRILRRILFQISINLALITAVFLVAAFVRRLNLAWLDRVPAILGGAGALLWLGAVVLSLPMLLVTVRKLEALSMMLSELTIRHRPSASEKIALRALVANLLWLATSVGVGLLLLLLSSPLLPGRQMLVLALVVVAVVGWLLRGSLSHLYARAQHSIQEALDRDPGDHRDEEPAPPVPARVMPPLLEAAELATVDLGSDSPAVGRTLAELALRSTTGALAVAIRRGDVTTTNPLPGHRLEAGDELLLLGESDQLAAAEHYLQVPEKAPEPEVTVP